MTEEEVDAVAKYLSHEVIGDFVFDGNDHGDAPEHYRAHARALLRIVRSLGWSEPDRVAGVSPGTCGRPEDHLRHSIPMTMTCPGIGVQICRPDDYQHLGPWEHVPGSDSLDKCEACGTVIGK